MTISDSTPDTAPYIIRPVAQDFLNAIDRSLEAPEQPWLVFHVWGVGGVGKSTLLRKAREAAERRTEKAATALVSFGLTEGIDEPIGLMKTLHEKLLLQFPKKPLQSLDPFSERHQQYFDIIHKLQTESEDGKQAATAEQVDLVKKGVGWAAKEAIGLVAPEFAAETVGMVAEAAVSGAQLALSEKDRLVALVQRHRATKDKRELQQLILQPVATLTAAFVESLMQWAKQRPILLMLDTYEKAPVDVDNWLWRSLLGNHESLRSVELRLLVMGRRNLLDGEGWRKLQQDRQVVYERSLQKFDPDQTRDYLQRIGITDATRIAQIQKVTRGLPYYLHWIWQEKQKGRELNFAEGNQEIARLLLQGLDQPRKQVIELAACCRWFDPALLALLGQQFGLSIEFDWLTQQSFVERVAQGYRLDDVARDVFRQGFCQENRAEFDRTFDLLMRYFKSRSDQEVPAAAAPPDKYENPDWRNLRTEYLYYLLFTRQANLRSQWISHLLEARYFKQDALVQVPLQAVEAEAELAKHPFLSHVTRQFLSEIRPAVEQGWAVLEEDPIDDEYNQKKYGLSPAATRKAVQICLGCKEELTGLALFSALFYQSKRCAADERLDWLQKAKLQAEQIAAATHPEFSSGLFLWEIGNTLYYLDRYQEAIESYDRAIEYKPDLHEAWSNRGVALSALGRKEEAIESYDRAIEYKPDLHEAWYNRGVALSALGRKEEAIESYEKAIEYKPDYHEAWYNRGNALDDLGRKEEAIESYDRAIEYKPDLHEAWSNRGNALDDLGRKEEAIESYDRAIEYKPDYHEAWYNRGNALSDLGRKEEAIESYDRAIEYKPDYHEAWYNRGNALSDLGRKEEAIESYDRAIEIKPDKYNAWDNRGDVLQEIGKYEEALASYNRAIAIKPDYRFPWRSRGKVLMNLGRYNEALSSFAQAITLYPDDAESHYHQARCYALQGNLPDTITALSQAISLDPDYRELAQMEAEFDSIRQHPEFQALQQNDER